MIDVQSTLVRKSAFLALPAECRKYLQTIALGFERNAPPVEAVEALFGTEPRWPFLAAFYALPFIAPSPSEVAGC